MISDDIRARLEVGLAALRINMKQASLAAGLSHTYVRDVIRRGRGKYENLELVANCNGISWEWLRTGQGDMIASADRPATAEATAIDPQVLAEAMQVAFHLLGATQPQAKTLADIVLSVATRPQIQPGAHQTKVPRAAIAPTEK